MRRSDRNESTYITAGNRILTPINDIPRVRLLKTSMSTTRGHTGPLRYHVYLPKRCHRQAFLGSLAEMKSKLFFSKRDAIRL